MTNGDLYRPVLVSNSKLYHLISSLFLHFIKVWKVFSNQFQEKKWILLKVNVIWNSLKKRGLCKNTIVLWEKYLPNSLSTMNKDNLFSNKINNFKEKVKILKNMVEHQVNQRFNGKKKR